MNMIQTAAGSASKSTLMQAIFAVLVGASLVFTAGFAHSDALHDAAHDVRHSTGFPCH